MKKLILYGCLLITTRLYAQRTFPVNGVEDQFSPPTAYTHLTLVKNTGEQIQDATILVSAGKISAAGAGVKIPDGYVIKDMKGLWAYPSFIDLNSQYGMPEIKRESSGRQSEEHSVRSGSHYWNDAIHPETEASTYFSTDAKASANLRKSGFGWVVAHRADGIARGTGALVSLAPERENTVLFKTNVSAHFSFNKGMSAQSFPSSLMGSIALLRQAFYDAKWYVSASPKETNSSLAALHQQQKMPCIFDAGGIHNLLRADKIGDEFGLQFIMRGGGDEYQYIAELKKSGAAVILPLTFPAAYELKTSADLLNTRLIDMQHWEMAPANAYLLRKENIPFSFTFSGLKNDAEFKSALIKIMAYGLTEKDILQALTATPAGLIRASAEIGNLEPGMQASFFITDGNYFDEKTSFYGQCLSGTYYAEADQQLPDARGRYVLTGKNTSDSMVFELTGKRAAPALKWVFPEISGKKSVEVHALPYRIVTQDQVFEFNLLQNNVELKSLSPAGKEGQYIGLRSALPDKAKDTLKKEIPAGYTFRLPYQYDWKDSITLIKNVQVWTCEKEGIQSGWDVLIENGKIKAIQEELAPNQGWKVIDGTGKHLTPGIIDEHSHIAISQGVNEGTQSVTSEVRIEDVVFPQDINIYRQLAGGVTTSHLLHGSANAIGGQTALIKMRYGASAEELKRGYNHKFIKFALGENVKQSNWGDRNVSRFPQTRMGVEQIIADGFIRAREYKKTAGTPGFKQDLELDALCEILEGKRYITCHSYQQGEINMLMHLGDSLGFKVNTFTHILEGYKVADKMKAHGAAASTFSDWWGYKFEVNDAIPFNAALLNEMGILTGINSDDAEMGRRLNQEAAKSLKYGNMKPEDAMKMITINPAKMLHIDQKTGSIAVGKDADLVLWNQDPLSVYAKALTTWVDGRIYYEEQTDWMMQQKVQAEKERLWKAMHQAAKNGEPTRKPAEIKEKLYHCDDIDEDHE
jgi:cytosine/adenosine deaminase-related metal-dependent hydrolase